MGTKTTAVKGREREREIRHFPPADCRARWIHHRLRMPDMERPEFSDAEIDELMRREKGGDEAAARALDHLMELMLEEIIGEHASLVGGTGIEPVTSTV